jgi:hypothetical protein
MKPPKLDIGGQWEPMPYMQLNYAKNLLLRTAHKEENQFAKRFTECRRAERSVNNGALHITQRYTKHALRKALCSHHS